MKSAAVQSDRNFYVFLQTVMPDLNSRLDGWMTTYVAASVGHDGCISVGEHEVACPV